MKDNLNQVSLINSVGSDRLVELVRLANEVRSYAQDITNELEARQLQGVSVYTGDMSKSVATHYILDSPHGDDSVEYKSKRELITELVYECDDVREHLIDRFGIGRNENEQHDCNDLYRDYAIETAEELGYKVHEVLR